MDIKSVIIPDSVTEIGSYAFCNTMLTSIKIPESVKKIGAGAFAGCGELSSISLRACLVSRSAQIAQQIFRQTTAIFRRRTLCTHYAFGKTLKKNCLSMTENMPARCVLRDTKQALTDNVTMLGRGAFYQCKNLTGIVIPRGISVINRDTFFECESLASVSIPDGVTAIGSQAFRRCGMSGINIPGKVIGIGRNAFSGCNGLVNININDGVVYIGTNAFSNCESITGINIPDSVIKIGKRAFSTGSDITVTYKGSTYDNTNISKLYSE